MGLKKDPVSSSFMNQDKCHFHIWVYASYDGYPQLLYVGEKYILDDPQVLWKCLQMKFQGASLMGFKIELVSSSFMSQSLVIPPTQSGSQSIENNNQCPINEFASLLYCINTIYGVPLYYNSPQLSILCRLLILLYHNLETLKF